MEDDKPEELVYPVAFVYSPPGGEKFKSYQIALDKKATDFWVNLNSIN